MYAKILIATDGSDVAARGLEQGLALAKALGSAVTIVTATEPAAIVGGGYASIAGTGVDVLPELMQAQQESADKLLTDAKAAAAAAGLAAATARVDDSFPAEAIVATAEKIGADLIVMGSHGRRGVSRVLLGSQASNVLTHTKVPVLVVR